MVDLQGDDARLGDVYVLCSDGLTDMVAEADIGAILTTGGDIDATSQSLIDAANDAVDTAQGAAETAANVAETAAEAVAAAPRPGKAKPDHTPLDNEW